MGTSEKRTPRVGQAGFRALDRIPAMTVSDLLLEALGDDGE
jgi:hypothetical protein